MSPTGMLDLNKLCYTLCKPGHLYNSPPRSQLNTLFQGDTLQTYPNRTSDDRIVMNSTKDNALYFQTVLVRSERVPVHLAAVPRRIAHLSAVIGSGSTTKAILLKFSARLTNKVTFSCIAILRIPNTGCRNDECIQT